MVPSFQQVHEKIAEIGLGQASINPKRYLKVEYLPWMYTYEFRVQSKKPEAIVTYDTLIYPFGKYVWYLSFAFCLAVFLLLTFIQKCWIYASGEYPPNGWVFQGISANQLCIS